MSKKKANTGAPDESSEMDMSPMIDMVFLLLIFFVVNANAITIKKDRNVVVPISLNSGEMKNAKGCIVANVYAAEKPKESTLGPDVFWGTAEGEALMTEAELQAYIQRQVDRFKQQGYEKQKLYIRADKKALFKYQRTLMRIAAACGVNDVVFGVTAMKG